MSPFPNPQFRTKNTHMPHKHTIYYIKKTTLNAIEYNAPTPQYTSLLSLLQLLSLSTTLLFTLHPSPPTHRTYFIYLNYLKYLYCYNKCTKRTLNKQTDFFIFHFSPFIPRAEVRATPTTIPTTTPTTKIGRISFFLIINIFMNINKAHTSISTKTRCDNTLIKYIYPYLYMMATRDFFFASTHV